MYRPPTLVKLLAYAIFAGAGAVSSLAFSVGLGDATWAISTGIGACMAAGVYEVGRPVRMEPVEAQQLDVLWQDFCECGLVSRLKDKYLSRSCRQHAATGRVAASSFAVWLSFSAHSCSLFFVHLQRVFSFDSFLQES